MRYEVNYIIPIENAPQLFDKETEQRVLGELTDMSAKQVRSAIDRLTIDSFYTTIHRRVFVYIDRINRRGDKVDLATIRNEWLKEVPNANDIPLTDLMDICADGYDSAVQISGGINLLTDLEKRRKMWVLGQNLIKNGVNCSEEVEVVISDTRKALAEIEGRGSGDVIPMTSVLENICQIVKDNAEGKLSERVTKSGIDQFDEMGGLQQGNLIIIAAESSSGKSSLANTICHNVIKNGHKVAFYSLEMTKEELTARFISSLTGIKANNILASVLPPSDMTILQQGLNQMARYSNNLFYEDKSTSTIDSILNSIRRMYYRYNIKGVVVDYLQLIGGRNKSGNKTAFIGEATRELKNIAKELGIWAILLSQLNRNKEDGNPFPTSDRLRDSGEILEACDVCLLIYRPEYYNRYQGKNLSYPDPYKDVSVANTALIIQSKGRNTGTGKWVMGFDADKTTFYNLDPSNLPKAEKTEKQNLPENRYQSVTKTDEDEPF